MQKFAQKFRIFRRKCSEVFLQKGVLKICSKFTEKHLCRSAISIKLICKIFEIALRRGCSPVNFLHIFRTHFPKNFSGWLVLAFSRLRSTQNVIVILQVKSESTIYYCNPPFIAKARVQNSKRRLEQ